ncbi:hypothetical protein DFJ73DRAFT_830443 [Zopfochytrium polystomum]|nr:hypothetical protein DFJ73DRAFT_830443 [Zopfochytrium polystomum]
MTIPNGFAAVAAAPSRASTLATFRALLREVTLQFTSRNGNPTWRNRLVTTYRSALSEQRSHPSRVARQARDAEDLVIFLRATREHRRLVELYWPNAGLSQSEKTRRTAAVVGLNMPPPLRDDETLQGGGRRRADLLSEASSNGQESGGEGRRERFGTVAAAMTTTTPLDTEAAVIEAAAIVGHAIETMTAETETRHQEN